MRRGCDSIEKYEKLNLKQTLNRSSHYSIACKELSFILRNAYFSSPKNLQAIIFQDTLLAFRLLPKMQTQSSASAVNLLLQSVEAVFPKHRKVVAMTQFRHAMIAHKKISKSLNDDNRLGATQLPQDVLAHIFSFLDVWSLISAAAVCRLWNDAAIENHLWESLYADFFDDCSPRVEVNQLNIGGGVNHNADVKLNEDLVTQTKTNWRDAFKRTYKASAAKKFNSHRGYCRHCNSLVWLSDTKISSKSSGDNCKHHKVKPVSSEQILDFLLNDHFTTYSSDSDSDDDDDKFLLNMWAYPSQMLPFIGSD